MQWRNRPHPRTASLSLIFAFSTTLPTTSCTSLKPAPASPSDPNDQRGEGIPRAGTPTPALNRSTDEQTIGIHSHSQRLIIVMGPAYGRYQRAKFHGRTVQPTHGAGISAAIDLRLRRWLWMRLSALYLVHPVPEQAAQHSPNPAVAASRGVIRHTTLILSGVYALDLGRLAPTVEAGIGGARTKTPAAVGTPGQHTQICSDELQCDPGSVCTSSGICEPAVSPVATVGIGLNYTLRRHLHLGGRLNYIVDLSNLQTTSQLNPYYLSGSLVAGLRF